MTGRAGAEDEQARSAAKTERRRYEAHAEIAAGGMARVHFGRLLGDAGFSRVVAVKKMHASLAHDPRFSAMFLDEARVASRIRHPNVVSTLDVVSEGSDVSIIMEYVRGLPLSTLLTRATERSEPIVVPIAASVAVGLLGGLHAAHEARGPKGDALGIVHRDVSPQNVLVDVDGVTRVMDFGIAKAKAQLHVTQVGELKGKLSYMAPEQIRTSEIDRRADVFSAGVVVWTMLAGKKLFVGRGVDDVSEQILNKPIPRLHELRHDVPEALDAAIARALEREPKDRFASAKAFLTAIEEACPRLASQREVGAWVERLGGDIVAKRDVEVAHIEGASTDLDPTHPESRSVIEDTSTDAPTIEWSDSRLPPHESRVVDPSDATETDTVETLPETRSASSDPMPETSAAREHASEPAPPAMLRDEAPPPRRLMLVAVASAVALLVFGAALSAFALWGGHPSATNEPPTPSPPTATTGARMTTRATDETTAPPGSGGAPNSRPASPDVATAVGSSGDSPMRPATKPTTSRPSSTRRAVDAHPTSTAATPPGYFPAKP